MPRVKSLGHQPFSKIVRDDGRSIAWLARRLDVPYPYVISVTVGRTPPSAAFRRMVSRLLGRPQRELFTPEALAATYRVYSNSVAPLLDDEVAR